MTGKIPKSFIHFFSLGSLTLLITLGFSYLVYPEKIRKVYKLILITDNKILLLSSLFLLPLIYTLGATALYGGEANISKYLGAITEDRLIDKIRFKKFSAKVEENLKLYDFIYASEANIWINESNKFYEYSNFFAGVMSAVVYSIIFFITVILLTEGVNFILVTALVFILLFSLPSTFYYKLNPKYKFLYNIAKITLNPLITSLFYTIILGITIFSSWEKLVNTNSQLLSVIVVFAITLILLFSSSLSIFFRKKANLFLILGATANKILKFNNIHLSDNGNGQHLCSPHDSSTNPQ